MTCGMQLGLAHNAEIPALVLSWATVWAYQLSLDQYKIAWARQGFSTVSSPSSMPLLLQSAWLKPAQGSLYLR